MHAEASMELNLVTEAESSLALVRQRAGLSAYPDASTIELFKEKSLLGHDELRAVIYHERRVELGLENDRFYDLVRWGDASSVFSKSNSASILATKSLFLPVAFSERLDNKSALDSLQDLLIAGLTNFGMLFGSRSQMHTRHFTHIMRHRIIYGRLSYMLQ